MITAKQIQETRALIDGVLSRWAPFHDEPCEHRMMRALLNLAAYERDAERIRNGHLPIREDYPMPLPNATGSLTSAVNQQEEPK